MLPRHFDDLAPVADPTTVQQRDALQKGLGRAVHWARTGKLDPALVLEACLVDHRYDHQTESCRGPWLGKLIEACGAFDRFRDVIFEAVVRLPEDCANQLVHLARFYASRDRGFRDRLHEIVRTKPIVDSKWLGETEWIDLDGEVGFLVVAGVRGERLDREPWDCEHDGIMRYAIELWGRDRVVALLESSNNPGVIAFQRAWLGTTEFKPGTTPSYADRMRAIPVEQILRDANGPGRMIWFRGWGNHANEADLRTVVEAIFDETDPARLARLLRVFGSRSIPEFDDRWIALARHATTDVRPTAIAALAKSIDPAVREFAIELLADPATASDAIELLVRNFAPGDEAKIVAALTTVPEDDLHSALMDARHVLTENNAAVPFPMALVIYRFNPCGCCRESIAIDLGDRRPDWMSDELRDDANPDARALVTNQDVRS